MVRVLIVNDDPDLVDACQMVLEDAGHTVTTALDVATALARVADWHPELVLLDWILTDSTGGEVLTQLRSDPATADLPVVVMSALPGGAALARAFGADDFLPKP